MFFPPASSHHQVIEVSVDNVSTEIFINPDVERIPCISTFPRVLLYLVLRHGETHSGSGSHLLLYLLVPPLNVLSEA